MKTIKPDGSFTILTRNSGLIFDISIPVYKNRRELSDEEKLEIISIEQIYKYLRKKKLENMNPDYYKDMANAKSEYEFKYGEFVNKYRGSLQKTTKEILDDIDIKEIEQYLRKKKLENLKNKE